MRVVLPFAVHDQPITICTFCEGYSGLPGAVASLCHRGFPRLPIVEIAGNLNNVCIRIRGDENNAVSDLTWAKRFSDAYLGAFIPS